MIATSLLAEIRARFPSGNLRDKRFVVLNLVFMYHVIVASEPLMRECKELVLDTDHKVYFGRHLIEESNHATWMHEDLSDSGIDVENIGLQILAAKMAGSQYYLIRHVSPLAIFGYLLVLECFPIRPETVDELEALHGLKLSCLRHHAVHDVSHGDDVLRQIDKLPSHILPMVRQNALSTVEALSSAVSRFGIL